MANVLVSNDSAPVHIAGAFDNWIVLIPSCKHPDHVLPYRNGASAGRNIALYKKLTLDDLDSQPTIIYGSTAEKIKDDWQRYLPDPESVVERVLSID
jgi:ADP-heptose:LPS heptosyltransferase